MDKKKGMDPRRERAEQDKELEKAKLRLVIREVEQRRAERKKDRKDS